MKESFEQRGGGQAEKVEASIGEHFNNYAERVAQAARNSDVAVKFNDIEFTVPKGEHDSAEIVATWEKLSDERREKYLNSPEGKAAAEADAQDIDAKQEQINELTKQLDTLDFSDVKKVLEWCVAFQDPSDRVGTQRDKNKILAKFAEHGYVPNMNTGTEYKAEDKENSAKYIIGQALSGIEYIGAVHQVVHRFSDEWKAKFNS